MRIIGVKMINYSEKSEYLKKNSHLSYSTTVDNFIFHTFVVADCRATLSHV